MSDRYILRGKTPVQCEDLMTWGKWMEHGDERRIAKDELIGYVVSTVFLGVDHSTGKGKPILFETMIFEGAVERGCWRYTNYDCALRGHANALRHLRSSINSKKEMSTLE